MDPILPSLLLVGGAAISGLAGSPHCVGMCGGFASASAARGHGVAWHTGRLSTYGVLGAVAAAGGAVLPGPPWLGSALAVTLLVWFSARLAGIAPAWHVPWADASARRLAALLPANANHAGALASAVLGAASALLPCGLLWAALAVAVASGSAGIGALSMVAFGVGTVPALGAAGSILRRIKDMSSSGRHLVAAAVLAAGLWSIGARASLAPTEDGAPPACHEIDP
jgi:sulfite exporter TauE/SafE